MWSKTLLSRYLVTSMFNITWCTWSTGGLAHGFFTVFKIVYVSKSFSKGVKFHLNSDPFSITTFCRRGYLHSYVSLNNWITLLDDLSMYLSLAPVTSLRSYVGISTISNQPVLELIVFMQARLKLFLIIASPGSCCIIEFLYMNYQLHMQQILRF